MNAQIKKPLLMLTIVSVITLSSFSIRNNAFSDHKTVSRTVEKNQEGEEVIKTQIILNKTTSREALIAACSSLREENVELTFELVEIRKILGKPRIAYAKGKIQLPDGSSENFKAGGVFGFKFIRITYFQVTKTNQYRMGMVEIVD